MGWHGGLEWKTKEGETALNWIRSGLYGEQDDDAYGLVSRIGRS